MAATRFRLGDGFTVHDYINTTKILDKKKSVVFCENMKEILGDKICCVPCKDLAFVEKPTVVGLGDTFIGGILPDLMKENRKA